MKTRQTRKTPALDQERVDRLVVNQSEDEAAWKGELAARAAFLARLHRETGVDKWVERVLRERVELEELAFAHAKKELASRKRTRAAEAGIRPRLRIYLHVTIR